MRHNAFTTPAEQAVDRASWFSVAVIATVLLVGLLRLAATHTPPRGTVSVSSQVRGL